MAVGPFGRSAACCRRSAAGLLQDLPEVIEPLREGTLCLSTIGELAKVLTVENQATVAPRFFGLAAREAQELVAELARVATPANFTAVLPRFFGCSSREARVVAAAIAPCDAPPLRDQVTRGRSVGLVGSAAAGAARGGCVHCGVEARAVASRSRGGAHARGSH